MMQVTLLGTGLPFPNPKRRGPGYLIRCGETNCLVDCGSGAVHQLVEAGKMAHDIDHVFITHLHSDHFIDLGHFTICHWIYGDGRPWNLYGPEGIEVIFQNLLDALRPDLELRNKIRKSPKPLPQVVVHELQQGEALEENGLTVSAFDVEHQPLDQPFGYRFATRDKTVIFSGDTCPSENLIRHSQGADVLIHECVEYDKWKARDIDHGHTPHAHTSPERLALLARDANVGLLVTTHMMASSVPYELMEIIRRDYRKPVAIGEDLMTV